MEPNSAPSGPERGEVSLPKPESLSVEEHEAGIEAGPAQEEIAPQSKEGANQNQGMPLPQVATQSPADDPMPAPPSVSSTPQPISGAPAIADDIDVIEKEWVLKAKDIIRHTRNDPHAQEREVSRLQADYLKKRYGKVVKESKT